MKSIGNVFIIGDSYSTFRGHIAEDCWEWYVPGGHENTDVTEVEQTWWRLLLAETDSRLVQNCSSSGTTICHTGYNGVDTVNSFIGRLLRRIEAGFFRENPVDTFLVFGGTNDSWSNAPVGEPQYADWSSEDVNAVLPGFGYLLHLLREAVPTARVIVILNTELKPEITENMKVICERVGVEYVSLQNIDKTAGHPNVAGMKQIAEQVLEVL